MGIIKRDSRGVDRIQPASASPQRPKRVTGITTPSINSIGSEVQSVAADAQHQRIFQAPIGRKHGEKGDFNGAIFDENEGGQRRRIVQVRS